MYVVRIDADVKAFEHLSDARKYFRESWSWHSEDGYFYDMRSIALFEVEAASDPGTAIGAIETGDKNSTRLIEVLNPYDLRLARWYLLEAEMLDVSHLSTIQIVREARDRAARLESLGPSFARRVPSAD